jgi:AcrR family transcriptional regulator
VAKTKGARGANYEAKRRALVERMIPRVIRPDHTRPSLRGLAEAAGASLPTIKHYFGSRDGVIEAVFEEISAHGRRYTDEAAAPRNSFAESIGDFVASAAFALRRTPLGDILGAGLAEGLLDSRLGPACVDHLVEPTLSALTARLEAHQAAGEMRPGSPRHAALSLFAPVLLACHHQNQLGGRERHAMDIDAFLADHVDWFVRAHAARPTRRSAKPPASKPDGAPERPTK